MWETQCFDITRKPLNPIKECHPAICRIPQKPKGSMSCQREFPCRMSKSKSCSGIQLEVRRITHKVTNWEVWSIMRHSRGLPKARKEPIQLLAADSLAGIWLGNSAGSEPDQLSFVIDASADLWVQSSSGASVFPVLNRLKIFFSAKSLESSLLARLLCNKERAGKRFRLKAGNSFLGRIAVLLRSPSGLSCQPGKVSRA